MPHFVKITAVHPDSHSVDVEMQDGRVLSGVQVMSQSASKTSGQSSLPDPKDNEVYGVMDFLSREIPVLYGFIYPQIGQCQFADNRAINRHHSGAYTSISEGADMEVFHPSGAYIRISEAGDNEGEHEDLTGLDVDGKWANTKNIDKDILITIGFVGTTSKIQLKPDGSLYITGTVHVTGDITSDKNILADGDVKAGDISLKNHKHGGVQSGGSDTGVSKM